MRLRKFRGKIKMVITAEEVKILDRNSEELGISVLQLMENAGSKASDVILTKYPDIQNVVIFCGTGNNGGDGFVVARHLASAGKTVKVFLLSIENKIRSESAKRNFQILEEMELTVEIIQISDSTKLISFKKSLKESDIVIDALLGIGITSTPYEPIKSAIKLINSLKLPIVSLDVPSGMFSDDVKEPKLAVNADLIITFHDTKYCLTSENFVKKTVICGIGIPKEAEDFVGIGNLVAALPKRKEQSHKGQNGTVLIVGGSVKYSGAPILASRAALRTGADLVITCIPESIASAVRSDSPNIIVRSFKGDYFNTEHIAEILSLFEKFDSMVVGPGISDVPETMDFVRELIMKAPDNKPIVVDADALKALVKNIQICSGKKILVTPHQGEFKILFGEGLPIKIDERKLYLQKIAKKHSLTILLKGKYDLISNDLKAKINRTGHEGMTTGGTGDVLAGILGQISAISTNLFNACCASAYLAGKAGEIAAEDFGNSLLATDVVEKIPDILLKLI